MSSRGAQAQDKSYGKQLETHGITAVFAVHLRNDHLHMSIFSPAEGPAPMVPGALSLNTRLLKDRFTCPLFMVCVLQGWMYQSCGQGRCYSETVF